MTPAEEAKAKRKAHKAKLDSAWAELALLPAFDVVLQEAQRRFGMFQPVFQPGDNYNPHAAALRDGNKQVLAYFLRRHARGAEITEDDSADEKPTRAI